MQKWEYKVFVYRGLGWSGLEEKLNAFGAEGWELVHSSGVVHIFKRPLPA